MRFVTPSTLIFAVILFLLPWVELRCETNTNFRENDPFGQPGGRDRDPFGQRGGRDNDPFGQRDFGRNDPTVLKGSLSVYHQSGLQSTWGEVSLNGLLRGPGGPRVEGRPLGELEMSTGPAPLMIGYALCLVAGIPIGFAMRSGKLKGFLLGGVCLAACALLLTQTAVGFPFFKTFESKRDAVLGAPGTALGPVSLSVGFTPVFYLAILATLASLVCAIVEAAVSPGRRSKPKRRRREDDDLDDDDLYERIRRFH